MEPRQQLSKHLVTLLLAQNLQAEPTSPMQATHRPYLRLASLALLLSLLLWTDTSVQSSALISDGTIIPTPCPTILTTQKALPASLPPLYLGLEAYRHWDKLAYLELGDRVEGESTADLTGSNADNTHILQVLPGGQHVLFDQTGPGIVTFLRMQETYGEPWQLVLDGQPPLTIRASDFGQVQPTGSPATTFPYPLSLNPQQSQGSSLLMTSLPFQQSFQWISQQDNGNFYALYRKLPFGTPIQTWTDQTTPGDVLALLRCVDHAPVAQTLASQQNTLNLVGGTTTTVTTLAGPSQIRALNFHVPFSEMVPFGNARLQIYWNGETHPSVDTPVKFLAGDGAGVYQPAQRPLVNSWITSVGGDGRSFMNFNLYWPMPFTQSARIVMSSPQTLNNIAWNVSYEPFLDPANWWGTFHANYVSLPHPAAGQDMTLLDVRGSGKLVGTVINFTRPGPTLEGDPHIYLDDSQTPQIAVTGTEEWGLGGDYWHGGQQVSLPLGGLPSSSNNPPGTDHEGAAFYRYLISDSIPYNRHLLVRWEHGGADEYTLPYQAALFWYGTPTQTAQVSDTVWPGQTESRASHLYSASHERISTLIAAYEETVQGTLSSARVASTTGITSFTMALNPQNVGAFLRRTFDSCVANQRANVFLDGQFAGTWYDAGKSPGLDSDGYPRCWRDEDFPLPAALTRGKTSVTVSLRFVPTQNPRDSTWTAADYQIDSFVLPPPATLA